ncbi:MAG TPA: hypothetical protein PKG60_15240 [Spirochaetota bacterium]|nr:hypothetical protein [Spirochaetota bacterium]HPS85204.1 hypothetical protein [Spirochaetota bacterium]
MKSVIIDTSSAILMYKCHTIPALLKYCSPVISSAVKAELIVPGYEGWEFFTELCRNSMIKVLELETEKADELAGSLHIGERSAIALYYEGKGDFIIMDDGKGSAFCRDNKIPYINALLAVKILFFKRLVTETEFDNARRWMIANGRYSKKVIEWAENADENLLSAFI